MPLIEDALLLDIEHGRGSSERFDVVHVAHPGDLIDGTDRTATCRAITLLRRRNDERVVIYETDVTGALHQAACKTIRAQADLCVAEGTVFTLSDRDFELLLRLVLRARYNRLLHWQRTKAAAPPAEPEKILPE